MTPPSQTDIVPKKQQNKLFYQMGSFLGLLFLCFCLFLAVKKSVFVASKSIEGGTVFINGTASIGETDRDFVCATLDWWPPDKCDYGSCSWGKSSFLNLDLTNPILINAIKAFSPLKIRLGGTLQDKVIYERQGEPCTSFSKNNSEMFGFSQGCLPMSRWDQLNTFFKQTGAAVIFGLNALKGRTVIPGGSAVGAWNSSEAESLIRYTVNKGHKILGWELGNELSGNGVGARVSAAQFATDLNTLQNIVQTVYSGFEEKPLILGPGGFFDENWFAQFIDKASESLQVVTQHIYNLGPGVDSNLIDKILDPSYLDKGSQTFRGLEKILKSSKTKAVAWVGEAGGAYNSGRNLVTNAFVFSFWYLDQLGMSSMYNTKTYCRQTLIGGNYGLLNTSTFEPNPDYYSALLWHRLMGTTVLSTTFSGTKKLRAYAHCSKSTKGITLLLINLDGETTVQVRVSTENVERNLTWTGREYTSGRAKFAKISRSSRVKTIIVENTREEYHLTAKDGDLQSQTIVLNGKALVVDSSGAIPSMEPIKTSFNEPINIAPFSIVFVHIADLIVPACVQSQ